MAGEALIDTLSIQIDVSTDNAEKKLAKISSAVKNLQKSISEVKVSDSDKFGRFLTNLKSGLKQFDNMKSLSAISETVKNISALSKSLGTYSKSLDKLNGSGTEGFANSLESLKTAVSKFDDSTLDKMKAIAESAKSIASSNMKKVAKKVQKATDGLSEASKAASEENKAKKTARQLKNESLGFREDRGIGGNFFGSFTTQIENALPAIKKAKDYMGLLKEGAKGLAVSLGALAANLAIKAVDAYVQSLKEVVSAMKKAGSAAIDFGGKIAKAGLNDFAGIFKGITSSIANTAENVMKKVWNTTLVAKFSNGIKNAAKSVNNLASSFARIGMYRVLRTAFKGVTDSLEEGIEALYNFDKGVGGSFSQTMDNITARTSELKASIGTLAGNIINLLSPAIESGVNLLTRLTDAISSVLAVMGGNVFYKAAKSTQTYGDTLKKSTKAAKEYKNQILGFDEINRLEDNSSSNSGNASGINFEQIKELPDWLKEIQKLIADGDWESAGFAVADKLNKVIEDWDAEKWGQNLGEKIEHGIEFGLGFFSNKKLFDTAGKKLAQSLNGIMSKVDGKKLGKIMSEKLNSVVAAIKSFANEFKNLEFTGLIADTINSYFEGIEVDNIVETIDTASKKVLEAISKLAHDIKLNNIVDVVSSVFGGGSSAIAGNIKDSNIIQDIIDKVDEVKWDDAAKKISDGAIHLVDALTNKLKELNNPENQEKIKNNIKELFDGIQWQNLFQSVVSLAWEAFKLKWQTIFTVSDELLSHFKGEELGSFIGKKLTEAIDFIGNGGFDKTFEGVLDGIFGVASGFMENFSLADATTTLATKVGEMLSEIAAKFEEDDFAERLVKWLDFTKSDNYESAIDTLTTGINDVVGAIADIVKEIDVKNITESIKTVISGLDWDSIGEIAAEAMKAAIEIKWKTKISFLNGILNSFTGDMQTNVMGASEVAQANVQKFTQEAGSSVDDLKKNVSEVSKDTATVASESKKAVNEALNNTVTANTEMKSLNSETANAIRTEIANAVAEAETSFEEQITKMKENVSEFKESAVNDVQGLKQAFDSGVASINGKLATFIGTVNNVAGQFQSAVQRMKSLWQSDWGRPHFQYPVFSISGSFDARTGSVPRINTYWQYAAHGGIIDGATPLIAGENGKEAIIPLEKNTEWIDKVAERLQKDEYYEDSDGVEDAIFAVGNMIVRAIESIDGSFNVDGMELARKLLSPLRAAERESGNDLLIT